MGPYCGVLRIGDLTIEVLPKVPTKFGADDEARGILIAMLRAAVLGGVLPAHQLNHLVVVDALTRSNRSGRSRCNRAKV